MPNRLWRLDQETQTEKLTLEPYEYAKLDRNKKETRFLILHPCNGDKNAEENLVECRIETQSLAIEDPLPFIAIRNSRGYRFLQDPIDIEGKVLLVSAALQAFLRHFRQSDEPLRLWVLHICQNFQDESELSFCTREYVDAMYDEASEVVDMAEYVSDLRDHGIIKWVYDETEVRPPGKWDKYATEYVAPRTFPIQFGTKCSNEAPIEPFQHVPLDMIADEIRVLLVSPSKDPNARLITHLAHCPLISTVTFHGISYAWGTGRKEVKISVNGQTAMITKNLANALCSVRLPDGEIGVWVDAICIDQRNVVERNRQVKRMFDIYDNALAVLSYVGEPDEDSTMAIELIKSLRYHIVGHSQLKYKDNPIDPREIPRIFGALYKFLIRPYFQRVWVIQEIAVATCSLVVCGKNFDLRLEDLETAAYKLQDMLRIEPALSREVIASTPDLTQIDFEFLTYVRIIFYFRHLSMRGVDPIYHGILSNVRPIAPGYLETLILTRRFQATVSVDKLYAVWNLAQDKEGFDFKIDYSQSQADAFTKFATAWSQFKGSLDIIGAAESSERSKIFYVDAPSWCPDWSVPSQSSCLIRREVLPLRPGRYQDDMDGALYSADGSMKQAADSEQFFRFEGNVLHSLGIMIDRLKHSLEDRWEAKTKTDLMFQLIFPLWEVYQEVGNNPYDDLLHAAWAAVHGDNIAAWPIREDNLECASEYHPSERYICRTKQSRHIHQYGDSYMRRDQDDVFEMVLRGREIGITDQGYLILFPETARAQAKIGELVIAILATCSVPVLLCEVSEGVYRFCGTCFVQGWMDGEMVTEYMGADSAMDFWSSLDGMEKLKII